MYKTKSTSLEEAELFCARLAQSHYENFSIASRVLPKEKRQDSYNIYAFCRWADDLGDEIDDAQESLQALAHWREELQACYRGEPHHPIFVALQGTVQRNKIPIETFDRLIQAFEWDQTKTRWKSFAELREYCKLSANPVGHLVLYLHDYHDDERQRLSDFTCTALQLANFWQDVFVDLKKDRVYLPQEDMQQFGVSVEDLQSRNVTPNFRKLMRHVVGETRVLFAQGLALVPKVRKSFQVDLEMFSLGGMKILDDIEAADGDVLRRRPKLTKSDLSLLFLKAWWRRLFR